MKYLLGDKVVTKKPHPCGSNEWTIIRTGADIKLKCLKCDRNIIVSISQFEKMIKEVKSEI